MYTAEGCVSDTGLRDGRGKLTRGALPASASRQAHGFVHLASESGCMHACGAAAERGVTAMCSRAGLWALSCPVQVVSHRRDLRNSATQPRKTSATRGQQRQLALRAQTTLMLQAGHGVPTAARSRGLNRAEALRPTQRWMSGCRGRSVCLTQGSPWVPYLKHGLRANGTARNTSRRRRSHAKREPGSAPTHTTTTRAKNPGIRGDAGLSDVRG